MLAALLLMTSLFANGFGQGFGVDQIIFLPTRRKSPADRSTVALGTPSSPGCTPVLTAIGRPAWVNSIAPQGVSPRADRCHRAFAERD